MDPAVCRADGTDDDGNPLPEFAIARLGTLRRRWDFRSGSGVASLGLSADGKLLAVSSDAGMAVWDAANGKAIPWFTPDRAGRQALFTPDGKTLVTQAEIPAPDGRFDFKKHRRRIQRWEVRTGRLVQQSEIEDAPRDTLRSPILSPSGRYLAFPGEAEIAVWDAFAGKLVVRFKEQPWYGTALAFADDGKQLAVVREGKSVADNVVALYDLPDGKLRHVLARPGGGAQYMPGYSPDGTLLVTSALSSLCVWDTSTGKLRQEIAGIRGRVAFTADGREMACAGRKIIRCYSVPDFKELRHFDDDHDSAYAVAYSGDGKRLARAGQQVVTVWDIATGKQVSRLPGNEAPICALAFSADGKALAVGSDGDGTACVWDLTKRTMQHRLTGHYRAVASVAFAADGQMLATGDGSPQYQTGGGEQRIRLWDRAGGKLLRTLPAHLNGVTSLHFAPDGKTLASGGFDGRVRLWNVADGTRLAQVRDNFGWHWARIAPEGKSILVASSSGALSAWRADMKTKLHDLIVPGETRASLEVAAFVEDGKRIVAIDRSGGFGSPASWRVWDAATAKLLREGGVAVGSVNPPEIAVAPDGRTLACFNRGRPGGVDLWDLETGKRFGSLPLSTPYNAVLAFSPDSKTLAYGCDNTTVLLWDVARVRTNAGK